jgi:hypothetical protein
MGAEHTEEGVVEPEVQHTGSAVAEAVVVVAAGFGLVEV